MMMPEKFKCDSCRSFTERKCFGKDGICFFIHKKPKYVNKSQWCNQWIDRKTGLNVAKTIRNLKKGENKDVLETSRNDLE